MSAAAKRWGRRAAIGVGALAVLLALAVAWGLWQSERTRARTVAVTARAVALPDVPAPEALARGRHLFLSRGCADCHGADGAGRVFVDEPGGLRLGGPQIAPGAKTVVAAYRPEDWDRAIRHGVAPSSRPLMVMPSEDYVGLSDEDFAALVMHVRALPPVDGRPAVLELPLPVRLAYGFGVMKDAAAKIDHAQPPSQPVAPGVTTNTAASRCPASAATARSSRAAGSRARRPTGRPRRAWSRARARSSRATPTPPASRRCSPRAGAPTEAS
ncbi:MAG: c-type cytochrome [Microthrixaceae bacterium]